MINHVWSVLCERISMDNETKLISYLTCVEGLKVKKLPAAMMNVALGSRWFKDGESEETLHFQVLSVSPNGEEKLLMDTGPKPHITNNLRTNIILNTFLVTSIGKYVFKVRMKSDAEWVDVAAIPFMVSMSPTAASDERGLVEGAKKIVTVKGKKKLSAK